MTGLEMTLMIVWLVTVGSPLWLWPWLTMMSEWLDTRRASSPVKKRWFPGAFT
jgi:hypothetical protein